MNVKKMFASLAGVLMLAQAVAPMVTGAATYSDELQGAYDYAYSVGITTMSSIDNANMYGDLTRGQLSKMISQWAEKEMGVKADTTAVCSFTDTDTAEGDLATYVVKSCQMGLMGQGIEKFRPNDKVTRGEFGTVLSRAIWGDKYDGENPYYAKHLQALKDAGIMTNISDPNATEMRGWVMLMLERAAETVNPSECNDPAVLLACSLGSDSCPAACKADEETTVDENGNKVVVKSGDLEVSATAAEGRKAILDNGISDLDTITLKASEAITLNSVTLERFGYSSVNDVNEVWLENADGVQITNPKSLNSKDTVKLTVKKDYKELNAEDTFTIVLKTNTFSATYSGKEVGSTIGFKVTDVESSAKNVSLSSYTPYQYDLVTYDGTNVTLTAKGKADSYHVEEGMYYDVAKLRAKAANSSIKVNGFTLTNKGTLDITKYVDDVKVFADDAEIKDAKWTINKDDELKVTLDGINVEAKTNITFTVSVKLSSDFDDFQKTINFKLANDSDFNAIESKTDARVKITATAADKDYKVYTFVGGKITLTNVKGSKIDANAGASDVVVGEGDINIGNQSIKFESIKIAFTETTAKDLEALRLEIAGDEYDGKIDRTAGNIEFTNVSVDKSGKVRFIMDVNSDANKGDVITFATAFGKSALTGVVGDANALNIKYDEAKSYVNKNDFVGSITLYNVTVATSKGSLENKLTKDVEFLTSETNTKTIFDGTYSAKKSDIYLKEFTITGSTAITATDDVTFHVYIDGNEVASDSIGSDGKTAGTTFSKVLVKKGESVKIRVDAEVYADTQNTAGITYDFTLLGEDSDGEDAGKATETTVKVKFTTSGSISVADNVSSSKNTVLLKSSNIELAKFNVKPSNSAEGIDLNKIILTGTIDDGAVADLATNDIKVRVGKVLIDEDDIDINADGNIEVTVTNETIPAEGIEVVVTSKGEAKIGLYTIKLVKVNESNVSREFKKNIVPALVTFTQENKAGTTEFTVHITKDDEAYSVSGLNIQKVGNAAMSGGLLSVSDLDTFNIEGIKDEVHLIDKVTYEVLKGDGTHLADVTIDKATYNDYFKVGNTYLKVYASNSSSN